MIRTAQENDWSQLFGKRLDAEKITLRSVGYRQKENIILFLNAFAEAFDIETRLTVPDETKNSGRVILDCRGFKVARGLPQVEILEGDYVVSPPPPVEDINDDLPF